MAASRRAGGGWIGRIGLRSRVARRLLLWTLLVGGLCSLLVATAMAVHTYRDRVATLQTNLRAMAQLVLPALEQSVWAFDQKQVELQLRSLEALPDVAVLPPCIVGNEERSLPVDDHANRAALRLSFVIEKAGQDVRWLFACRKPAFIERNIDDLVTRCRITVPGPVHPYKGAIGKAGSKGGA